MKSPIGKAIGLAAFFLFLALVLLSIVSRPMFGYPSVGVPTVAPKTSAVPSVIKASTKAPSPKGSSSNRSTPVFDQDGKKIGEIFLEGENPIWHDTNGYHADDVSCNESECIFNVYADDGIRIFADYVVCFQVINGKIIITSV